MWAGRSACALLLLLAPSEAGPIGADPRAECNTVGCAAKASGLMQAHKVEHTSTAHSMQVVLNALEQITPNFQAKLKANGSIKNHEPRSSDLTELTLLAGSADDDVELTETALDGLGWKQTFKIADSRIAGNIDEALIFTKDRSCLAVFAATNDKNDEMQVIGGLQHDPVELCGFNIAAGFADEMAGFMRSAKWADFLASLAPDKCDSATAVGHSLGGAVASVFAACMNVGAQGFGVRQDVGLVVFAPPPVASEPLYSGTPGTPFVGTRYGVTQSDGGISKQLPSNTKPFRSGLLGLFATLTGGLGMQAESKALADAKVMIDSAPETHTEAIWAQVEPTLTPLVLILIAISQGLGPPGSEQLIPHLMSAVTPMVMGGFLFHDYDVVSNIGTAQGFTHALVDFQAVPAGGGSVAAAIASAETSALPLADTFQLWFSIIANGNNFPHHQICCYTGGADCAQNFKELKGRSWKGCTATIYR